MSAILSATRPCGSRANSARNFNNPTVLRTSLEKEEVNTEALNLEDGEEDEPQEFIDEDKAQMLEIKSSSQT